MKFVYIDKEELVKTGRASVLSVQDAEDKAYAKDYKAVFYRMIDNNLPEFLKVKDGVEAVEMPLVEAVDRGLLTLGENERVVGNRVATIFDNQKVINGEIVEKSLSELLQEELISVDECQRRHIDFLDGELSNFKKNYKLSFTVDGATYTQKLGGLEKLKNLITDMQIEYNQQKEVSYNNGSKVSMKEKLLIKKEIKRIWEFEDKKIAYLDFKDFDNLMSLMLKVIDFLDKSKFAMVSIVDIMTKEQLKDFDAVNFWQEHYKDRIPVQIVDDTGKETDMNKGVVKKVINKLSKK